MSIEKFITDILNINAETIEKLNSIPQSDGSIIIKVRLKPNSDIMCPLCNRKGKIHGYSPRKLIHSTLVNRKCTIVYEQRRYKCENCEYTFKEINPFISSGENVTFETKVNVLKDLKYVNETYTSVARRYSLSITKVMRIFDRHVNIERKTLPTAISIDEHYFPESNYDSLYCCLLMNFENGEMIDVLPDRKKECLIRYFSNIRNKTLNYENNTSELNNVKFVSIDLYDNYKEIAKTYFPHAMVCADSFHVTKHLTEAFRQVRLRCRRNTEDENLKYLLTKFKFVFNHDFELDNDPKHNKRFNRKMNYRDLQELAFKNFPDLKKAYELKENYLFFNESANVSNAKERLADQIKAFADSSIKEYDEFYNMLINWNVEIINSFNIINNRRINNSYIESRNSKVEKLFLNANGFKNFKRTRNRILYCLNIKDTYKI